MDVCTCPNGWLIRTCPRHGSEPYRFPVDRPHAELTDEAATWKRGYDRLTACLDAIAEREDAAEADRDLHAARGRFLLTEGEQYKAARDEAVALLRRGFDNMKVTNNRHPERKWERWHADVSAFLATQDAKAVCICGHDGKLTSADCPVHRPSAKASDGGRT